MLTNKATPERVAIPHEPEEWMKFRPLSWRQLVKASQARTMAAIAVVGEIPVEVYERMGSIQEKGEVPDLEPAEQYDKATVLGAAITEWSYDEDLAPENIDVLDEETSDWAFRTALGFSVRSKEEGEGLAPNSNGSTSEMGAGRES